VNSRGGYTILGRYTHISFYVGVTLQSSVFKSPGTGQFKTPDLGLAVRKHGTSDPFLVKLGLLEALGAQGQVQEAVGSWSSVNPIERLWPAIHGHKHSNIQTFMSLSSNLIST
jgi:hypothetical protein